jgi:carbon-monoxide dehydrogenase medium subunit
MTDSTRIDCDFAYYAPSTLAEALGCLREEGALPLAGGTDLINDIKMSGQRPRALVYLPGIPELRAWEQVDLPGGGRALKIGAACRLRELERRLPETGYDALREAVKVIGSVQIRNMATLAGNLCTASPAADTPPALLVLAASLEIASGANARGRRMIPLADFFTGPKRTCLAPGELVTAVLVPGQPEDSGTSFRRLARVSLDIAKISCAVFLTREGRRVKTARIALGAAAPTPLRAVAAEARLAGKEAGSSLWAEAAAATAAEIRPITDVRSSEAYRRRTAAVLVREALELAWRRAGGA